MDKHPYAAHRADIVSKQRVAHIAGHKHRASGGRVHNDAAQDRKLIREEIHRHDVEGKRAKHRRDRPMRARGGKTKRRDDGGSVMAQGDRDQIENLRNSARSDEQRAAVEAAIAASQRRAKGGKVGHKKNSHVNVNVITGGHGQPQPVPMPMPPPAAAAPPMPPPGLGAPAPGAGGPPGLGGPPGMMPPRKRGGRVKSTGGPVEAPGHTHGMREKYARGGGVKAKSGPAWEEGRKAGTSVQHSDGKGTANTPANLDRGRQITFKSGGKVKSFYARGGKVEAPKGMGGGPDLPGGVMTGETRIAQAGRAKRNYAKPMKGVNEAR